MAEKLINTIIQVRRDTQANWTAVASEFIPKEGEPCLTLDGADKGKVKYGDGVTTWGALEYSGGDIPVTQVFQVTANTDETDEAAGAKYATKTELTDGLAGKVDVVAGKGLSTEDYTSEDKTKLAGIATGAQVNVIDGVSDEFEISAEGKVLGVKGIASSKITGLGTSLEGKVDKVDGSSLVPDGDITKLQGLANIKSVASGELQISETGELGVSAIDSSKVTGLSDALNGKISGVKVNGVELTPDASKKVDIPLASTDSVGVIKGATEETLNGVVVNTQGYGEVKKIDMAILEPNNEVTFVLNGGKAPNP